MARLPTPGSDNDVWGDILNDYLLKEHRADGSHNMAALLGVPAQSGQVVVSDSAGTSGFTWQSLSPSSVGLNNVTNDAQLKAAMLDTDNTFSADSDGKIPSQKAVKSYVDNNTAATPDATATTKGKLQLAGDLGGNAAGPTVKTRTVTKTVGPSGSTSDYICDGTADNVELQAAIDAVNAAGGGTLYIRQGTYALVAKVKIRSNVHLVGEDQTLTTFTFGTNINDTMLENYDTGSGNTNIWVQNLTLNANGGNNSAGYALHLSATTNCRIDHVGVTSSFSHGILLDGVNSSNAIRDCSITGVINSTSVGIYVNSSTDSLIARTKSFGNPYYGFYVTNSSKVYVDTIESYSNGSEGFIFWATSDSKIYNSEIYSNGTTGLHFDNGSHRNVTRENYMHNNGLYGVLGGVSVGPQNEYNEFLFNRVEYNGDDALVIDHANYAVVKGNFVRYNGSHAGDQGLPIDTSLHVKCIGNHVEYNRADGIEVKNGSNYCTIVGNVSRNNSNPAVGGLSDGRGIVVRDGIVGCTIAANAVFCDEASPSQVYGIELTGAGNDYNTVTGNTIFGNAAGQIHLLSSIGTHNTVAENSGGDDGRMQLGSKTVNPNTGTGLRIQQTGSLAASQGAIVAEALADQSTANAYGLLAVRQTTATSTNRGIWVDHAGTGEGIQVRAAQGKGMIVTNNGNDIGVDIAHNGNSSSAITSLRVNTANAGTGAAYALAILNGRAGFGTPAPTAAVDTPAGLANAAGLRIRPGVAPTTPNSGDVWQDGTHLYMHIGSTTYQLDQQSPSGGTPSANWSAIDNGLLTWAYDFVQAVSSTVIPNAGQLQCVRLNVAAGTVTNIIMDVGTAGVSLTGAGAALYQNGNLLSQTADQSTNWTSTNGKIMPLTMPATVTAGYVYVAFWANGTTLPAFQRGVQRANVNVGLSASTYRFATSGSGITTTPPNTLGTLAASSTSWWVSLS